MKKKILWMIAAILLCGASVMLTSCSKDDDNNGGSAPQEKAKYTIMFYGCGGGDVDVMLEGAFNSILNAVIESKGQVRFMVMYSMSKDDTKYKKINPNFDPNVFWGELGMTYRYEMCDETFKDFTEKNGQQLYRERLKYKPASEVKLYEKATLMEYIEWCKKTAPAENYILIPCNHGGGFDLDTEVTRGIMYDDTHKGMGLSVKSIAAALKETNTHLKAIYWYGCLMGQLEVLTETAPYCDYQFTSTHVARVNEDHPVSLIKALTASPNDFEQAALKQRQYLETSFLYAFKNAKDKDENLNPENCDFGCWRSDKIAAINAQVKEMGELITSNYTEQKGGVDAASMSVYVYEWQYPHVDVLDYADNLALYMDENAQTQAKAKDVAENLRKAIEAANVYRINGVFRKYKGTDVKTLRGTFSLGISLYTKEDDDYQKHAANFKSSAFDQATGWSKWLDMNTVSVMPETIEELLNPVNNSDVELWWLDDDEE